MKILLCALFLLLLVLPAYGIPFPSYCEFYVPCTTVPVVSGRMTLLGGLDNHFSITTDLFHGVGFDSGPKFANIALPAPPGSSFVYTLQEFGGNGGWTYQGQQYFILGDYQANFEISTTFQLTFPNEPGLRTTISGPAIVEGNIWFRQPSGLTEYFHFTGEGTGSLGVAPAGNLYTVTLNADATYGPPITLPEPATWLLLLTGLGVFGWYYRKGTRSPACSATVR